MYRVLGDRLTWTVEGLESAGTVEINDGRMVISGIFDPEIYERVID